MQSALQVRTDSTPSQGFTSNQLLPQWKELRHSWDKTRPSYDWCTIKLSHLLGARRTVVAHSRELLKYRPSATAATTEVTGNPKTYTQWCFIVPAAYAMRASQLMQTAAVAGPRALLQQPDVAEVKIGPSLLLCRSLSCSRGAWCH